MQDSRVPEVEKRRQTVFAAFEPGLQGDIGAYAGRITLGERERKHAIGHGSAFRRLLHYDLSLGAQFLEILLGIRVLALLLLADILGAEHHLSRNVVGNLTLVADREVFDATLRDANTP